jgi:hypothetical protein
MIGFKKEPVYTNLSDIFFTKTFSNTEGIKIVSVGDLNGDEFIDAIVSKTTCGASCSINLLIVLNEKNESVKILGGENAEIFSPQYQNSGATKSELTETKIENGIIYLTGYGLNCTQNELEPCLSKNWQKLKTVKFKIEGDKLFEIK